MCDCQWREIETAPKDATVILGAFRWSNVPQSIFFGARDRKITGRNIEWRIAWDHTPTRESPTHWMPLPEPPK
jgi:hypothetical protein